MGCVWCEGVLESANHLFITCNFATKLLYANFYLCVEIMLLRNISILFDIFVALT